MGVKVDRNARVVLDLEAIWMICSKLDISMNHRSPATATFKAQLVTETPAIEMEKKNVFEQDRSFETLDFLGFEKIAVAIGPPRPPRPSMSITWKVEAKNHCLFFGEKSPMALPTSRCSFEPQSRSSAVERALQAVVNITTAGSGGPTRASTLGLDQHVTMKAGDCGALLPDLGLFVLRARLKCRNFSEAPRVCTSYMVPILQEVMVKGVWRQLCSEKQVMVKGVWRQLCSEKQVCVGPCLRSFHEVEAARPFRASAWSPSKAGKIGVLLAHTPCRALGAELESSRDFFEARKLFSAWLVGLRDNRSEPPTILYPDGLPMAGSKEAMVQGNLRQLFSAKQARSPSESFWKNFQMTPPAARCSFALQSRSSAVDGEGFNRARSPSESFWKNFQMTPPAARCSFALQSRSSAVDKGGFNRAGKIGVLLAHTPCRALGAELPTLVSHSGQSRVSAPQFSMLPILLKAMVQGNLRQLFSAKQARSPSESFSKNFQMTPPTARCSFALLSRSSAVDGEGFNRAMQAVVNTTRAVSGRLTSGSAPGLNSNATMKAGDCGALRPDFQNDSAVLAGSSLFQRQHVRSKPMEIGDFLARQVPRVCQSCILPISPTAVLAWLAARSPSVSFQKNFRMTPPAARCSFALQSRSSAVDGEGFNRAQNLSEFSWKKSSMTLHASRCSFALQSRNSAVDEGGFNRAMQAVVNTTRAVSGQLTSGSTPGLDSNATMKAGDCGALLPDLGLCVFRERLECRHFLEVPRVCQSCILLISPKANIPSPCRSDLSVLMRALMRGGKAHRYSFELQNRSRVERADFNRAMQAVVNTTRAVSGGLTGVSTRGLDSNVTMKARDRGALLPDVQLTVGLCGLRARLKCRNFSEVPRVCQSCILLISPKADGKLPRLPRPLARSKKMEVTLPVSVKQAIYPVLDRDIWRDRMTTSMSRCSLVLRSEEKEEQEEILQATDSVFRPMSWSRRLKAQALDSDSQLCGPPVTHCAHEPLHLNDIWTPLKHPGPAEAEDLPCRDLRTRTDLAEDAEERVELRKGCRLLTVQSRKRYPLATTARTQRTQWTQQTKRRKEVLCDVAEKTGAAKLVAFSGALRMGRTTLTLAGMDLAGWPQDSFSQIDLGHKLALQNPFESVLIETGAVLQECEPEELVVLTLSYGGNSGYRLASNIERSTGRTVRGVVMWDFITPFGRGLQGPPLFETPAFKTGDMKGIETYAQLATASPDFRCSCEHPIQMATGYKTGEMAIDLLMNRERGESAVKVMYKKLQIQKVQECHFGYERSNWDMLRLLLSTRPPNTADAADGDIGAA